MVSFALTCQPGSALPERHTLARTTVGFVPVTWVRMRTGTPASCTRPGTTTVAESSVSTEALVTRCTASEVEPPGWNRTLAR